MTETTKGEIGLAQRCKQRLGFVGVGITLLTLLLAPTVALAGTEPNDGITQAEGPLSGGIAYEGTLAGWADTDAYLFYISGQQQISVEVTALSVPSYSCLQVAFGDSDNALIESGSVPNPETESHHLAFLYSTPPGLTRYYLELRLAEGNRDCNEVTRYSVTINPAAAVAPGPATLPPIPTAEPNDTADQAAGPLLGNVAYTGELQTSNDQDWFKFYTAPGVHHIDVAATSPDGGIEVFGPSDEPSDKPESCCSSYFEGALGFGIIDRWLHETFTSSEPGVYYLELGNSKNNVGAGYEFVIQPPGAITTTPPWAAHKVRRGYAMAARIARVLHRRARLRLWCKGAGNCKGSLKLIAHSSIGNGSRGRASKRKVLIGHAGFSVGQGRSLMIPVGISRKGRVLLHRSKRGRLHVKLAGRDVRSRTVVLIAGRHRQH